MAKGHPAAEDRRARSTRSHLQPVLRMELTMVRIKACGIAMVVFALAACNNVPDSLTTPSPLGATAQSSTAAAATSPMSWGPETPHFNLQVILRGEGFGLVKFRQPNDDALII